MATETSQETKNPPNKDKKEDKQKSEREVMQDRLKELETANGRLEGELMKSNESLTQLKQRYNILIRKIDIFAYNLDSLGKNNDLDFIEENREMERRLKEAARKEVEEEMKGKKK